MSIKFKSILATASLLISSDIMGGETSLSADVISVSAPVHKVSTSLAPRFARRVISFDEHRSIYAASSQRAAVEPPKKISLVNSVDSISEYNPYMLISFSEIEHGLSQNEQKLAKLERSANELLLKIIQEQNPRPNDFYNKVIDYIFEPVNGIKQPYIMIYHCAKALRHTTTIIGGNAQNRVPNMHSKTSEIYDLDLLTVSSKLIDYGYNYTKKSKFDNRDTYTRLWERQKETTSKHIEEVEAQLKEKK